MNIFKKIALINKLFKIIEIVKDFTGHAEIKEGKHLINEGLEHIARVVPDSKELADDIKKVLK